MQQTHFPAAVGGLVSAVVGLLATVARAFARLLVVRGAFRGSVVAAGPVLRPLVPVAVFAVALFVPASVFAGTSPWEDGVEAVCDAFFGPIGKGLAIVAVVIGGLMFAFGEGGSKSAIAGLVFGAGMVLGAAQFLEWLGVTGGGLGAIECG